MTLNVPQLVRSSFQLVADKHKLKPLHEISDEQQYSIDFICDGFNLAIDKYRQEFYPSLYKPGHKDDEANLFNVLAFLAGDVHKAPSSEFFRSETNIEAKYRHQLDHIASTLNNHYDEIAEFFRGGDIDSKFADLNRFMIDKYPHLFKRASDEK